MDRVITVQSFDPQQGVIFEVLVDDNRDVSVAKQLRRAFHFLTGRAACLWQQSHDIECGSILDLHWSPSYWETVIGILRPASRAAAQPAAGFFLGYSARRSAATSDGCAPAAATCLTPDIDSAHLASTGRAGSRSAGKDSKVVHTLWTRSLWSGTLPMWDGRGTQGHHTSLQRWRRTPEIAPPWWSHWVQDFAHAMTGIFIFPGCARAAVTRSNGIRLLSGCSVRPRSLAQLGPVCQIVS